MLEADSKTTWYVFRKWGRVGTTSGGSKLSEFRTKAMAVGEYAAVYLDKTGNEWCVAMVHDDVARRVARHVGNVAVSLCCLALRNPSRNPPATAVYCRRCPLAFAAVSLSVSSPFP